MRSSLKDYKELTSPPLTQSILAELGHLPKKIRGQHFLIDGNILRKSIDFAKIEVGDTIVEVGPGLGVLTQALLAEGARVYAVEVDKTMVHCLKKRLLQAIDQDRGLSKRGSLELYEGDCVEHPLGSLTGKADLPPFKIVANLPYAVSSPWMEKVLAGPLPTRMVLMVQREAANRYCAVRGSKSYSPISLFLQSAYQLTATHHVSHHCFWPKPAVASTLVCFERLPKPFRFSSFARQKIRFLFQHRRKQIGTLTRGDTTLEAWCDYLVQQGIPSTIRPEAIPEECWQKLPAFLQHEGNPSGKKSWNQGAKGGGIQ